METKLWKAICKFESVNPDYIDYQLSGLLVKARETIARPEWYDETYCAEKVENSLRFFTDVVINFRRRVKNPELAKEFVSIYDSMRES